MEALAYWVISDHFEELGRPPRLFHNGFGLLTRRQPAQAALLGGAPRRPPGRRRAGRPRLDGDGADVLVRAWATRHDDGTIDVLVWNGTVNAELMHGDPRLDRARRGRPSTASPTRRTRAALARVDAARTRTSSRLSRRRRLARRRSCGSGCAPPTGCTKSSCPHVAPGGSAPPASSVALPQPGVARVRLARRRHRRRATDEGESSR